MFEQQTTRTAQTEQLYEKRIKSLVDRARVALAVPPSHPVEPRALAAWMVSQRPQWSAASWRQYRSAIMTLLERDTSDETLEAMDYLREHGGAGTNKNSAKTSATKLKKFPADDFLKLTDALRNGAGKWHLPLLDWLVSATLTGLRPQEWASASLETRDEGLALVVQNAKNTNERSHGPTRTLLLAKLSPEELDSVRSQVRRANEWAAADQFQEFYSACAQTLYQVSRRLWPRRSKHVTLYSCRHQFTANAKSSGFGTVEIAAMMGHAVDTTATRHYGRKTAGFDAVRILPIDEDVAKVKEKFETKRGRTPAPRPEPSPKRNKASHSES